MDFVAKEKNHVNAKFMAKKKTNEFCSQGEDMMLVSEFDLYIKLRKLANDEIIFITCYFYYRFEYDSMKCTLALRT